jgi:YHS domain-containing protein
MLNAVKSVLSGKRFFGFLVLVLVGIVTAVFVSGCKKSESTVPAESSMNTSAENVVEDYVPAQGEYKTVARCPVTGDKVIVSKNTPAAKYKGKIYYFCCPMCGPKFKAEPDKYAK